MRCPSCNGVRYLNSIFEHSHDNLPYRKSNPVKIRCPYCDENGQVDDRYPEWKAAGEKLKQARIERRETLRDFCNRTHMDVVLRSRQELGFSDPSSAI